MAIRLTVVEKLIIIIIIIHRVKNNQHLTEINVNFTFRHNRKAAKMVKCISICSTKGKTATF